MCDESAPNSSIWVIGVLLGLAASVMSNLGVNIQKYSFMQESRRVASSVRPYLLQPLWALGLFFVFFGSIGDFVALGFAPTSLVIPIGGFTLVANLFFAHLWLKERLGQRDLMATFLIVVGVILVAVFAEKKGGACVSFEQLVSYYFEPAFIAYEAAVLITILGFNILVKKMERMYEQQGPNSEEYQRWYSIIHPVSYPCVSGICGGQSVLLAKSTAELIKSTINGGSDFHHAGPYFIIVLMFVFIFSQIHLLTKGLKYFDAIFVVPVFQCFFITSSVIGGIIYFKEIEHLSLFQIAGFVSGLAVLLVGVILLAQRKMNALRPIQRFRAAAHAVRFMLRLHKSHKWNKDGTQWNFEVSPDPACKSDEQQKQSNKKSAIVPEDDSQPVGDEAEVEVEVENGDEKAESPRTVALLTLFGKTPTKIMKIVPLALDEGAIKEIRLKYRESESGSTPGRKAEM